MTGPVTPVFYSVAAQRRFAASMLVSALKSLQPLFQEKRADTQYFEAVESLVWLLSSSSDQYFETLGFDPVEARSRVDFPLYAELALTIYHEHRKFMLKMYVSVAKYTLSEKKVPYLQLLSFAEQTLAHTTILLENTRNSAPVKGRKVSALSSLLMVVNFLEDAA